MAYRTGTAQGPAVQDRVAGCDGAARNARLIMIVAHVVTGVDVGGAGLETAYAVTASPAGHGVEGVKTCTMKTANGMKATAPMEPSATTMKAAATVEAATTTTTTTARVRYACER